MMIKLILLVIILTKGSFYTKELIQAEQTHKQLIEKQLKEIR